MEAGALVRLPLSPLSRATAARLAGRQWSTGQEQVSLEVTRPGFQTWNQRTFHGKMKFRLWTFAGVPVCHFLLSKDLASLGDATQLRKPLQPHRKRNQRRRSELLTINPPSGDLGRGRTTLTSHPARFLASVPSTRGTRKFPLRTKGAVLSQQNASWCHRP